MKCFVDNSHIICDDIANTLIDSISQIERYKMDFVFFVQSC